MRGNRKVFVVLVVTVLAFALSWAGRMTAEFAQIAMTALLIFGGANAVEHWRNGAPTK